MTSWVNEGLVSGDVHESVREADFCAVDGAIAGGFDEGEVRRVVRVEEDGIEVFLCLIELVGKR